MQLEKFWFRSVLSSKIHFLNIFFFPIWDPDSLSCVLCFCLRTAADLFLGKLFPKNLVFYPVFFPDH